MASRASNNFLFKLFNAGHDWDSASWVYKIMLVKSSYTFNPDHDLVNDVTGGTNYELNSGAGATNGYESGFSGTGRKTIASGDRTTTQDDTNDKVILKITVNTTWTALAAAAGTVGGVILFYQPGGSTTDADLQIVGFLDIADTTPNGSDFTLTWDATNGIIQALT